MGGSQKSKRVRWPSDDNLCQVRLFLSEETPAQVGFGSQDHLQAKTSWSSNSNSMGSDDNLPPGFEGTQPASLLLNKLPQIPLIKWRCPPRFVLDDAWSVVAGEESIDVQCENKRENTVLEAIYPRPSAIPQDPSTEVGAEVSYDEPVVLIPITPIEDEDADAPAPAQTPINGLFDSVTVNTLPMSLQAQPVTPAASSSQYNLTSNPSAQRVPATEVITGVDPNVVAAAHAALSAVMTNNNQGNMIDHDLLIKILSDPKMVEQLVKNHGASTSAQTLTTTSMQNVPTCMQHIASISTRKPAVSMQYMPATTIPNIASTTTQSIPGPGMQNRPRPMTPGISLSDPSLNSVSITDRHLAHLSRTELAPAVTATSSGVFYPLSRIAPISDLRPPVPDVVPAPSLSVGAPVAKDINYYKSLIQQHGAERQEPMPHYGNRGNPQLLSVREPPLNNPKSRDLKPKIMKPCMYFNSSKGCRNGANCAYQHDESSQQRVSGMPDSQSAKRMKMDREITGT